MDDDCSWSTTRLGHEIIADLESLQGVSVEWEQMWPYDGGQFHLLVATADGELFNMEISIKGDEQTPATPAS